MKRMEPDPERQRFPHSLVWTPIPVLSWIFPFIGHMGICTLSGIIRDFAGPYYVSEDNMAFGSPTRYWQLDPAKVYAMGSNPWDTGVLEASEEYKHRMFFRISPYLAALPADPHCHCRRRTGLQSEVIQHGRKHWRPPGTVAP
ncbi:transmembrane protein 222-like isoform X2 [Mobula birostris]|uniref:transmembrane protein 222-like isoform X2 n=1 Tax=Mobula birostris TaxID=1983395 RepID=UPI003B28273B